MSSSGAHRRVEAGDADFLSQLRAACATTLPAWLETRRWFADKGRGIAGVDIEDALVERVEADWLALTVVRVAFGDGQSARYLLPLALTRSVADADVITMAAPASNGEVVVDATTKTWFGGWLLKRIAGATVTAGGAWVFAAHPAADAEIAAARGISATVVRAEQSNSSLRFGDVLMIKLFRRLQPGPNPDEEVLRALTTSGFDQTPRYAGSVSWRSRDGETYAAAVALGYVPNAGDGWTWMLRRLASVASGHIDPRVDPFSAERLLGQRTGELHGALAGILEPGFLPEAADRAAIDADELRTRAATEETIGLLHERQERLPETIRTRMPEAVEGLRTLARRADGYRDELGAARIRVHGDYHLGQTLRTLDEDWTIVDFEGEPARSLDERRQRTSALKDVAGMLRSFAYARGVAERAAGVDGDSAARDRLAFWETEARRAFLAGYRAALVATAVRFVPAEDEAFGRALAAWELDKALYEIAYEARNRPDWIEIPLRALLPDLLDQPADAAGGVPA